MTTFDREKFHLLESVLQITVRDDF